MFGSDADRMVHPLCFSRAKTCTGDSNKHGSTRSNHLVPIPGQPRTYTSKPSTLVTAVGSISACFFARILAYWEKREKGEATGQKRMS